MASGRADEFSSVDLNCVVTDGYLDTWRDSWPSVVERCAGPLLMASSRPGAAVGGYALTAGWERVELTVHREVEWLRADTCRVLYDPKGLLRERIAPSPHPAPFYPGDVVSRFLFELGRIVVALRRGELIVAHTGFGSLRDLLVQLMLAEQGAEVADSPGRLNHVLSPEQRRYLGALPNPGLRADEITRACLCTTQLFVTRARSLAEATHGEFPADLLVATSRHLRKHLG